MENSSILSCYLGFYALFNMNKNCSHLSVYLISALTMIQIIDNSGMKDMMRSCPNALVKFQVYNKENDATYADKRLNRIKTKNTIPMGPWAKMIVEGILQSSLGSSFIATIELY